MNVEIKAFKAPQGIVFLQYEAANANADEALRRAESEGYRVVSFKTKSLALFFAQRYRFPLALFSQELLSLIEAGLPPLESIETLVHKEQKCVGQRSLCWTDANAARGGVHYPRPCRSTPAVSRHCTFRPSAPQ